MTPFKISAKVRLTILFFWALSALFCQADSINTWSRQTAGLPSDGSSLRAVTYGNGLFVGVGDTIVARSADGTNWVAIPSSTSTLNASPTLTTNDLTAIAYGNKQFVAAGNENYLNNAGQGPAILVTSPDGIHWVGFQQALAGYMNGVAFGNGVFVAMGFDGTNNFSYTSADGTNWSVHLAAPAYIANGVRIGVESVAFGNGLFTALLYKDRVLTSPDGIVWTSHTTGTLHWMNGIGYGQGKFVICGDYGDSAIFSSSNGISWTPSHASPIPTIHNGLPYRASAYGNGAFVVVGSNSMIDSTNALDWLECFTPFAGNTIEFYGVTYANGLFVAVGGPLTGGGPPSILTSGSFIALSSGNSATAANLAAIAATAHGSFLAVGSLGEILASTNGLIWKHVVSQATGQLTGVASAPGDQNVIVGENGTILFSTDGLTWNPVVSGTTSSLSGVAAGNGVFVAVGQGGLVLSSTNGTDWSRRLLSRTNDLAGVAFGNGTFATLADQGTILLSQDAMTWTPVRPNYPPGTAGLVSISFGNGEFVGLDSAGNILNSIDGLNWSTLSAVANNGGASPLRGVTAAGGLLLAVGNDGTIVSAPWTVNGTGTDYDLHALAYGAGKYVAVGDSGTIVVSVDGGAWSAPANYVSTPNSLFGVAYGNIGFVGVGENGWVVSSSDGVNWNSVSSGVTVTNLSAVAFGSGRFVAVGQ